MLDSVTPVILTRDEEPNIKRTLLSLGWARRILVVDSGSTDATARICREMSSVEWISHDFVSHCLQWEFALKHCAAEARFVLALDADMSVSAQLREEIRGLDAEGDWSGAWISFSYLIRGQKLNGSFYPPQVRLLRQGGFSVEQVGHTHRFVPLGRTLHLRGVLEHDDRKSLEAFLAAQVGYSEKECARLCEGSRPSGLRSWVRRWWPGAPLVAWLVAYARAGGPFVGPAASRYALERLLYETLLRYRIVDRRLQSRDNR